MESTSPQTLRQLALREAQLEFPTHLFGGRSWIDLDASTLRMAVIPLSLEYMWKPEEGKRKALTELLQALSDADFQDPEDSTKTAAFLDKYGVDNEHFLDETEGLSGKEKLEHALFGRMRRPKFYFQVEELARFLDESTALSFRQAT